jgi:hypothetical protein
LGRGIWNDTRVELPFDDGGFEAPPRALRDVFTGAQLHAERIGGRWAIPAAVLFDRLPVSLLVPPTPCST